MSYCRIVAASWAELGVKPASALSPAVAGRGTDRFITVEPSLRGLLPDGLPRGSTVAVTGQVAGRTSLLLGLLSAPSKAGSWCAVVGLPRFSLAAGMWTGVDEGRLEVGELADSWPGGKANPHQIGVLVLCSGRVRGVRAGGSVDCPESL
jgi:hypothetical protein